MRINHFELQCKNATDFVRMKHSSPVPISRDESLVTPTVYHEERLLSPPPAPVGCVYDDRDALTNPGVEERQTSSSREVQNIPILEFPSIPNIPLRSLTFTRHERRGGAFTLSPSYARQGARGRGHRRSNSFDAITPFPTISLRPRFSRSGLRQSPLSESLRQTESQRHDRHDDDCECYGCRGDFVLERPTHSRAHTYNCDSTVFTDTFADAFAQETLAQTPPAFPGLPNEMDITSLERDFPPISPPKSTFCGPPSTFEDRRISRPIPRKITRQTMITAQPPDEDKRNVSEGNTICTTLSSSNNSAFGTPTREKIIPHMNSPLTSGSDSTSPEARFNRHSQNGAQPKGMSTVGGFPPTFPQCKSNERASEVTSLFLSKSNTKKIHNENLPFDEVDLHEALHLSLSQGRIHEQETSNENKSKH